MSDSEREAQIDATYELMLRASTKEAAEIYFWEMCRLIRDRSREQIFAMETERRLIGARS